MDENVRAAMARWPHVPEVYGWLSLSSSGEWRLHPLGDAQAGGAGEPIGNAQIRQFIDRNYAADESGRWFFQNGPQRVFVRLDAAPYIAHACGPGLELRTHNTVDIPPESIEGWWLDETGRLYAQSSAGACLIAGRDTAHILQQLYACNGNPLLDELQRKAQPEAIALAPGAAGAWVRPIQYEQLPVALGFVRLPSSNDSTAERPAD